jgi:hypothetical protein
MKKSRSLTSFPIRKLAAAKVGSAFAKTRVTHVAGGLVVFATKVGGASQNVKKVTVLVSQPQAMNKETAQQIRRIVESPISDEQRIRVGKLAAKALMAQKSASTARFRKASA